MFTNVGNSDLDIYFATVGRKGYYSHSPPLAQPGLPLRNPVDPPDLKAPMLTFSPLE